MMNSLRMKRDRAGADTLARKKVPVVIKKDFVKINIAMVKRHFFRAFFAFKGARQKRAYYEVLPEERRVHARRQMVARGNDRADIGDVDRPRCEVALPSRRIDRVKRINHLRPFAHAFDPHFIISVAIFARRFFRVR